MRIWISIVSILISANGFGQEATREWMDSTGKHKVVGTLDRVEDEFVHLRTSDGRQVKIPLSRLSKADQEFLANQENPFQEVSPFDASVPEAETDRNKSTKKGETPRSKSDEKESDPWAQPKVIEWSSVNLLDRENVNEWNFSGSLPTKLLFETRTALLSKKLNFHEDIRRLEINPMAQRAVVGYTVSFTVPRPLSRLALVDLVRGKTVHTPPVEADMCPLCLLNDGSTALMFGTGRDGNETGEQIQLWKIGSTQVHRSSTWRPFVAERENTRFGRNSEGALREAIAIDGNNVLLVANNGLITYLDILKRKPLWYAKLGSDCSVDASVDRNWLAIMDGSILLLVNPKTGKAVGRSQIPNAGHTPWPAVRWSPSGRKIVVAFGNQIRLMDVATGKWEKEITVYGYPIAAARGFSYPHDDYVLLDNSVLYHLPTQIQVCEYKGATQLKSIADVCFVSSQEGDSGFVAPFRLPHPVADKVLDQAINNPSTFLIYPGVGVSVSANDAGEHAKSVTEALEKAAIEAGFQIDPSSSIVIDGAVTGPTQKAVSYIAAGAYIANEYQSTIKIVWKGKAVWSTVGTNIPGMIMTEGGKTIQQTLDELGTKPNLAVFNRVQFPKMLQRPSESSGRNMHGQSMGNSLMTSKFSGQGIVDGN